MKIVRIVIQAEVIMPPSQDDLNHYAGKLRSFISASGIGRPIDVKLEVGERKEISTAARGICPATSPEDGSPCDQENNHRVKSHHCINTAGEGRTWG